MEGKANRNIWRTNCRNVGEMLLLPKCLTETEFSICVFFGNSILWSKGVYEVWYITIKLTMCLFRRSKKIQLYIFQWSKCKSYYLVLKKIDYREVVTDQNVKNYIKAHSKGSFENHAEVVKKVPYHHYRLWLLVKRIIINI